jgi:Tol biopolymer transport system component
MASTGEDPTRVTFGPGVGKGPSWSPDGKGIAFTGSEGDVMDIWVMRWD